MIANRCSCKDAAHKWKHARAVLHGNTRRCGSIASARLFSCVTHSASQNANHQISSPGPDRLRVWPVCDQHVCRFVIQLCNCNVRVCEIKSVQYMGYFKNFILQIDHRGALGN